LEMSIWCSFVCVSSDIPHTTYQITKSARPRPHPHHTTPHATPHTMQQIPDTGHRTPCALSLTHTTPYTTNHTLSADIDTTSEHQSSGIEKIKRFTYNMFKGLRFKVAGVCATYVAGICACMLQYRVYVRVCCSSWYMCDYVAVAGICACMLQ